VRSVRYETRIGVNRTVSSHEASISVLTQQEILEREEELKTRVIFAREFLKDLKWQRSQAKYLVEEAIRYDQAL
jgi:hypothetical protein